MTPELLTALEMANRLKVGRSTIFEWLRQGVFQPGRHFVKVGRVLRFIWSDDIVTALVDETVKPKQAVKQRKPSSSSNRGINWNY